MCGIIAYHGSGPALPALLDGLSRLEHRGYDSSGVTSAPPPVNRPAIHRAVGRRLS